MLVALGSVLVSMSTEALGGPSSTVGNSTTFADSSGEDPNAPDIVNVVISNDDAGNITIQINISNRPALTSDMLLLVSLDTDQNSATGDPQTLGTDYGIQLTAGSVDLFHWNGSTYASASSQASLTYSYTAAGATIRISASDLGKPKAFKFGAIAVSGITTDASGNPDFTNIHTDAAPDLGHGFFTYQVLTKLILSVTAYTTSPKPAKAARPFSATLAANENDTGGPVQAGTVTCSATIAFKRIGAATHALTNGVASCVWRIPATAKGKTIRGTITLTVKGVSVARTFSSRIN
jgi:hypothetical protein